MNVTLTPLHATQTALAQNPKIILYDNPNPNVLITPILLNFLLIFEIEFISQSLCNVIDTVYIYVHARMHIHARKYNHTNTHSLTHMHSP